MFFIFDLDQVREDAFYVRQQYFPSDEIGELSISKVTRLKQQGLILELCNYRRCLAEQRAKIESKAREVVKISAKPVYVFRELMHYLTEQRIVVPGYSFMQDTIGLALTHEHFEVKRRGQQTHWTLHSPRIAKKVNHPFFNGLKQIDIHALMHFVDSRCQFFEAFDHILTRYAKTEADNRVLTASLIAWATNMGIGRMGEISDIGYQQLKMTSDNFIRLETLREANDKVSNAIAQLVLVQMTMKATMCLISCSTIRLTLCRKSILQTPTAQTRSILQSFIYSVTSLLRDTRIFMRK